MKKYFISSALILSFLTTFSFAQPGGKQKKGTKAPVIKATVKPQEGITVPFVNKTLANGLEIIVLPDSSVPLVTVEMAVRNGSFTETLEFNGLSHLYEHLFFKPNRAIRIYRCDQYLKTRNAAGYRAEGCAEQMRYKEAVGSLDYLQYVDEMGSSDNATTREEVVNYFFTTTSPYLPTAIKHMSNSIRFPVFKLAEESLGSWKKRPVDPFKEFPLVEHPPLKKSEGVIVKERVNSVLIQVGWHGPSIGKDDDATYAADVFSYILAQPDSKFNRAMVDSGLTVQSGLNYYTQRNVGPITMLLVTSPDKAKAALKKAYEQIEKFDDPSYYSDRELENAKTLFEARDLYEREKLTNYSHTLAFWWSTTGIDYFRDYYKNLRAVSRKDINRYVKTYIKEKPRVGVALISADSQRTVNLTEADLIGK